MTLNETQTQTISGQDFTFDFIGLAPSDGSGGTFILHAQGDYGTGGGEILDVVIDGGIFSAGPIGGFASGGTGGAGGPFDFVTEHQLAGNYEFQRTYAFSAALLDAMLADTSISIFVDLDFSVGLFEPPNFVEVTVEYNMIPEPSTALLLALGLVGLAVRRLQ